MKHKYNKTPSGTGKAYPRRSFLPEPLSKASARRRWPVCYADRGKRYLHFLYFWFLLFGLSGTVRWIRPLSKAGFR